MPQWAGVAGERLSRVVALAAPAIIAGALTLIAPHVAADPQSRQPGEASVKIKALPPSVHADSGAAKEADEASTEKPHTSASLRFDDDEDFESISRKMPWVIGLIFLVVGSIFLTPIVLLVGIIWYKLRKARLQNEAMLALAEKGVVPPAQVADALATGAPAAAAAPQLYQQAASLRRRVVWSDLRKGIILTTLGLAFSFYWLVSAGEPSWLGLVLLFVGAGYVVLWWLEGRHLHEGGASSDPGRPGVSGS